MKISVIDTPIAVMYRPALGKAIELAEQNNDVIFLCPDAIRVAQLRDGDNRLLSEWKPRERALYLNGKRFTEEGIHFKNNPGEFASHIDTSGKLYYTDALGQAVAWGEIIHIFIDYEPSLLRLREDFWRLVLRDKLFILHDITQQLADKVFGAFKDGKQIKGYEVV